MHRAETAVRGAPHLSTNQLLKCTPWPLWPPPRNSERQWMTGQRAWRGWRGTRRSATESATPTYHNAPSSAQLCEPADFPLG